jgi:hypothetical protein
VVRPLRRSRRASQKIFPREIVRGYERYLKIALGLPGTEESTGYGTPAVRVRGKFISRWRIEAEGALAIRCDFIDRQMLLQAQPDVFFVTDHYRDYPMILVHLDKIRADALRDVFERAWRRAAPESLVEAWDAERAEHTQGRPSRTKRPRRAKRKAARAEGE